MNAKEYIASGILDLYVMGSLSPEEQREVEAYAKKYPEVATELKELEDFFAAYAASDASGLPADGKEKLMLRLSAENKPGKVVSIAPAYKWVAAASVLLFIGSSMLAFYFYGKLGESQQQLAAINAEKDLLTQNYTTVNQQYAQAAKDMTVIKDTAYRVINMKGMAIAPQAFAKIYWNPLTKKTYLDLRSLPSPAAHKQYQLWAIVDGKPVDMGVFDMNYSSMMEMKAVENPQAFAVTLEPRGGNASPTLEAMYVLGNV